MINKVKYRISLILMVVIISLLPISCQDEFNSSIPWVEVNMNIALANYIDLNVPGNYIYFPSQGFAGIIVFCDDIGVYTAYDAACTYDISKDCSLLEEGAIEGVIATCPCCGSKYSLFGGGYVLEGLAAEPLKTYRTQTYNNGTRLKIYN